MTTYTIPTNAEYWGNDVSDEEAMEAAKRMKTILETEFPEVIFRLVPQLQTKSNRPYGDNDLIETIRQRQEQLFQEGLD